MTTDPSSSVPRAADVPIAALRAWLRDHCYVQCARGSGTNQCTCPWCLLDSLSTLQSREPQSRSEVLRLALAMLPLQPYVEAALSDVPNIQTSVIVPKKLLIDLHGALEFARGQLPTADEDARAFEAYVESVAVAVGGRDVFMDRIVARLQLLQSRDQAPGLREQIKARIAFWREEMLNHESVYMAGVESCADDLDALLHESMDQAPTSQERQRRDP